MFLLDSLVAADSTPVHEPAFDDGEEGGGFERFDALDTNGSGRIEWYEWPGSWASFEAQDLDRNGVLTWGEVSAPGVTSPIAERIVEVDPTQRWTDTGLWVTVGEILEIDALGTVQMSTNANDLASPTGSHSGRRAPNAPLPSHVAGVLIARSGDSAPMAIGDDHLADNVGAFTAYIAFAPRWP